MRIFNVDKLIADELEKNILVDCLPSYKHLKSTAPNYNYNNKSTTAGGIDIVNVQGFTNPIYTYTRHFPLYGKYEDMVSKINTPLISETSCLTKLIFGLRDQYLDSTYDIIRVYMNLMTIGTRYGVLDPHPDIENEPDAVTFLYYVNDSDGDTFIFNELEDKIMFRYTPTKGTGIIYPSGAIHAASVPMKHEVRSALNIIYCKDFFQRRGQKIYNEYVRRTNKINKQHSK